MILLAIFNEENLDYFHNGRNLRKGGESEGVTYQCEAVRGGCPSPDSGQRPLLEDLQTKVHVDQTFLCHKIFLAPTGTELYPIDTVFIN